MNTEIIKFTFHGKRYRLKPWFNTLCMGAIWGVAFVYVLLMFLCLFL